MQADNKMIKKREEEIKNTNLSWFTLPQRLRLVLCKLAKISTKNITRSVYNPCSQQVITASRSTHFSPQHSHLTEPLS